MPRDKASRPEPAEKLRLRASRRPQTNRRWTRERMVSSGGRRGEVRLPAAVAVLAAIALYAALPTKLILGPRYVIPILEALLFVAVLIVNPRRFDRESARTRVLSLALVGLIVASNLVSLGFLVNALLESKIDDGKLLLLGALQVWLTNIIAFGLLYWELDRGGPVARMHVGRSHLQLADFRFTHDEDHDTIVEVAAGSSAKADWVPTFVDYLYVSVTNSTAFSPTDTMPLSSRAKLLMSLQCISALVVSLLVVSRAVGILN